MPGTHTATCDHVGIFYLSMKDFLNYVLTDFLNRGLNRFLNAHASQAPVVSVTMSCLASLYKFNHPDCGHISDKPQIYLNYISTISQSYISHISTLSQEYVSIQVCKFMHV